MRLIFIGQGMTVRHFKKWSRGFKGHCYGLDFAPGMAWSLIEKATQFCQLPRYLSCLYQPEDRRERAQNG